MIMLVLTVASCNQHKVINNEGRYNIIKDDMVVMTIFTDGDAQIKIVNDMACYKEDDWNYYVCYEDAKVEKSP